MKLTAADHTKESFGIKPEKVNVEGNNRTENQIEQAQRQRLLPVFLNGIHKIGINKRVLFPHEIPGDVG